MTDQPPEQPRNQPPEQLPRNEPPSLVNPDQPRRRKVVLILLAVLLFAAGIVSGVGVSALSIKKRFHLRPRNPHTFPERVSQRLQWKFDLSDEKTQRIEAILSQRLDKLQQLHRDIHPAIEQEMRIAEEEVAQELTPDQARQWRKWFNRRCREHWSPPPPRHRRSRD